MKFRTELGLHFPGCPISVQNPAQLMSTTPPVRVHCSSPMSLGRREGKAIVPSIHLTLRRLYLMLNHRSSAKRARDFWALRAVFGSLALLIDLNCERMLNSVSRIATYK